MFYDLIWWSFDSLYGNWPLKGRCVIGYVCIFVCDSPLGTGTSRAPRYKNLNTTEDWIWFWFHMVFWFFDSFFIKSYFSVCFLLQLNDFLNVSSICALNSYEFFDFVKQIKRVIKVLVKIFLLIFKCLMFSISLTWLEF